MFKLIKGNWENLEGKVLSYSKFTSSVNNSVAPIYSMYSSVDLLDFNEKMGVSYEKKMKIDQAKEIVEKTMAQLKKDSLQLSFFPIYSASIKVEDEKEIITHKSDIIFAGNWSMEANCMQSNQMVTDIYYAKYCEQLLKRHGLEVKKNNILKMEKENTRKSENYQAYEGKSLREVLLNEYIRPIFDAKNSRDFERVNILGSKMVHFMQGASFVSDGLELMALAKIAEKKDYGLVDHYINKIDAIHLQKFEDAAKYRDIIAAIKK